jgi:hypothetical protein
MENKRQSRTNIINDTIERCALVCDSAVSWASTANELENEMAISLGKQIRALKLPDGKSSPSGK